MYKILFAILITVIGVQQCVFSQTANNQGTLPGYAVMAKGDTLRGEIKFRKKESYAQNMSVRFPDQNVKSVTPKTAVYVIAGDNEFESYEVPGSQDRAFFKKLVGGKINFYQYDYEMYQFNNTVTKSENYVKKSGSDELIKINNSNYKKKLGELISDNKEIMAKIEAKDSNFDKIQEWIKQYNEK